MEIIRAIKNGNFSEVNHCIAKGEDINMKDPEGRTALMLVARSLSREDLSAAVLDRYKDVMILLLRNGADIMIPDNQGYTVFSYIVDPYSDAFQMIKASSAADSFLCGVDTVPFDHKYENLFVDRLCYGLKSCEDRKSFENFLQENSWHLSEELKSEIELYYTTIFEVDLGGEV